MVVRNVFFCDHEESINNLFFECPYVRLVWRVIHFTFNIAPPTNCTNMFENWLNKVDKYTKARIQIETCAIVWSLWNYRNDMIFNKKKGNAHFLQVICTATHWIHEWSFLLPEAQHAHMDTRCTSLETVARDIFKQGGWRLSRRLLDA